MKAGWELRTLQQVSTIVNGGTPDTNVPEYWDGDNLWITPKDMGKLNGRFVDDTFRKLTLSGLKNSSAKILPQYSLILSSRAPIGHLAINSKPISTNQGCKGIIPSDNLDTFYLYYFLLNSVEYLNSLGTGATFKELSGSKLGQVEIPLPPLPEQQRIVSILDEAFSAIDKAKANAEKNLMNAKELFESYLQGVFENSSWKYGTIGDVCRVIAGQSPEGKYYNKIASGLPFYQGKKDYGVKYLGAPTTWTTKVTKEAEKNDILISVRAPVGPVNISTQKICIGRGLAAIRTSDLMEVEFLYNYLLVFERKIVGNTGAVFNSINKSQIEKIDIPIPSIPEQITTIKVIQKLSSETKRLESIYQKKLTDLEELKKSILRKAFNGELNTADLCV